jgi:phospholipid/cholesterol/gamma-HCH transport system permease protein
VGNVIRDGNATAVHPLAALGGITLACLRALGRSARFTGRVVGALRDAKTWSGEVASQMRNLGVASLPIAAFIALFTGIVLALLASYSFTGAVPLYFVGTLVEKTITLELAPVLTGLALAGRVGANIAAELGTMRVTEQIDALETLGYDPLSYLVAPRVIAGLVMFPVVVGVAMLVAVGAGGLASVALLHLSPAEIHQGIASLLPDVRRGIRPGEISELRCNRDARRRRARLAHRRRRGRCRPGRDRRGGVLLRAHPRSRRVLGGHVAARQKRHVTDPGIPPQRFGRLADGFAARAVRSCGAGTQLSR